MRRRPGVAGAAAMAVIVGAGCSRGEQPGAAGLDGAVSSGSASAAPTSSGSGSGSAVLPPAARAPLVRAEVDAAAAPVSGWAWKTYRGDKFTALFPGDPRLTVLPAEDDKIGYTEALLDMPGGQVSFMVGFSEHSKEEVARPEVFLDEHADAPRRGVTDVLHRRAITLPGGHPGRVLILRRNISGTPLRVYSRLHLVGQRLYSLIVSTLDVGGISEDVVKKFMESFKPQ